jgi:hypothetical protein
LASKPFWLSGTAHRSVQEISALTTPSTLSMRKKSYAIAERDLQLGLKQNIARDLGLLPASSVVGHASGDTNADKLQPYRHTKRKFVQTGIKL